MGSVVTLVSCGSVAALRWSRVLPSPCGLATPDDAVVVVGSMELTGVGVDAAAGEKEGQKPLFLPVGK